MTSASTGSTADVLAYDAADELTSLTTGGSGQTVFSYDRNGNRTGETGPLGTQTTYGYDQANRLTSYIGPAMNAANGAATTGTGDPQPTVQLTYTYNGDGLRMSATTSTYTWDVAQGMPLLLQDTLTSYVTDPSGLPLEQIEPNGTVLYYHHDQLGSTRALTDPNGHLVATYAYDPYGNAVGTPPAVANPFQYAGQYKDVATGLYDLRARYYQPRSGQFLSRDPMVATTRSPYDYVGDNPSNATDPSGKFCLEFWDSSQCDNPLTDPPNCTILTGSSCQPYIGSGSYNACSLPGCSVIRQPDYSYDTESVGMGLLSLTLTHIYDRAGNSYVELGPSVGPGLPVGGAHGWGWIGGSCSAAPSQDVVSNFITGLGASGGMTIGAGIGLVAGGPGLPQQYSFAVQLAEGLDPVSLGPSWGWQP